MNEPNFSDVENCQADLESCLKRFRPVEASASIAETFYEAGWRAAVASQVSLARKCSRARWSVFLSGAACGMLPMLVLLINNRAGVESTVSKIDLPSAPLVQPIDEVPGSVDLSTSGDSNEFRHSSQSVAIIPSAIDVLAETFMLRFWFPQLQISESSISASSTLRFRPLTNEGLDLVNINQRWSASSQFLTTADDSASSSDPRESLSVRSSVLNDDFLRELSL